MPVELTLTQLSSAPAPKMRGRITAIVTDASSVKEFSRFSYNITQGEPQAMPPVKVDALPASLRPAKSDEPLRSYTEHLTIYTASTIFPTAGRYQIQFRLEDSHLSNTLSIDIEEPAGIYAEAFNEVGGRKDFYSFDWVNREKTGLANLRRFVAAYGNTPYGGYAIEFLANIYRAEGEIEKAKVEFEKLVSNEDPSVAKRANAALCELSKRCPPSAKAN